MTKGKQKIDKLLSFFFLLFLFFFFFLAFFLRGLHLSTAWPHFREDTVLDNAVFSELNPMTAPTWSVQMESQRSISRGRLGKPFLMCLWEKKRHLILSSLSFIKKINAGQLLGELGHNAQQQRTWTEILGREAFQDDEEEDVGAAGRGALDALANRRGNALLHVDHWATMVGKTVGRTVTKVNKMARDKISAAGGARTVQLTEEDLDLILPQIFLPDKERGAWEVELRAGAFERWDAEHAPPQAMQRHQRNK